MSELKIVKNPVDGIEWPHTITENTFDDATSDIINQAFKEFEESIKGKEEKIFPGATGFMSLLFFPDTSRWNDVANDLWDRTELVNKANRGSMDNMVTLMICAQPPNSYYPYHIDVDRKQLTGVCYWGDGKNGTVLKSGDTEVEVKFAHNRAVWFSNIDHTLDNEEKNIPWHRYYNDSDTYRYTVNINYCTRDHIKSFLKEGEYFNMLHKFLVKGKPSWSGLFTNKNK